LKTLVLSILICTFFVPYLSGEDKINTEAGYTFDVSHVNHAWGYRHKGYYVDGRGYIYSYDHSGEKWQYEENKELDSNTLASKYKNRKLFAKIESKELAKYINMTGGASRGEISPPVDQCNDFGYIRYTAFTFDSGMAIYTPVKIFQAGDKAWQNNASEAKQIYRWLNSIIYDGKPHPCAISDEK